MTPILTAIESVTQNSLLSFAFKQIMTPTLTAIEPVTQNSLLSSAFSFLQL